jgi:serine/threonine-protein kinase HipA
MNAKRIVANVLLHGEVVGALRFRGDTQSIAFIPGAGLRGPHAPVLGQQFVDDPMTTRANHILAPPWFSNLLPEGPLRTVVSQAAGTSEDNEFKLLTWLGEDLPGAVAVVGARTDETTEPASWAPPVDETAFKVAIRHSLSGVQLKLSGAWKDRRLTVAGAGALGECIIKLPPTEHPDLAHNEAAMMHWARAAGIEVPPTHLVPLAEVDGIPARFTPAGLTHAYVIERFDRTPDGGRVHVEDFAQILNVRPTAKYDSTLQTVANIVLRTSGVEELKKFIHRLAFCAACGNNDAHLKNWCLIYPDKVTPRLAPAYDFVSTVLLGFSDKTHLPLLGQSEWSRFEIALFDALSRKLKLEPSLLRGQLANSRDQIWDAWQRVRTDLPLTHDAIATIEGRRDRLPMFRSQNS